MKRSNASAGCTGSVKTTNAQGTVVNQNLYTAGDDVYLSGSNFPGGASFSYTIEQTNGSAVGPSGSFSADAGGDFLRRVWTGASGSGVFKVEVTYTPAGRSQPCKKSDNFHIRASQPTSPPAVVTTPPAVTTQPPAVTTPPPATTQAVGDVFSCRASAARVRTSSPLPALLIEPVVANDPDVPCLSASKATLAPTSIGPITAAVLSADTAVSAAGATASARVADAGLDLSGPSTVALPLLPPLQLPGLLPVKVTLATLNSSAAYTCQNGQPAASGSSQVLGLRLQVLGLDVPINLPDPGAPVDIDLGGLLTVHLNQQVVTADTITQRAVSITSALLGIEVALAESIADISGNPCGAGAAVVVTPVPTPTVTVPVVIAAVPGTARLTGAPPPGATVAGPFTANVVGRQVATVRFTLDGKPLSGPSPTSARVTPGALTPGRHTLRARVTFTRASGTPPRTLTRTFRTPARETANGGGANNGGAAQPRFTG
jgi:hypothetical protein